MTEAPVTIEISSNLSLRRATAQDLDAVWGIIEKDSKWLSEEKDLHHWAGYYTKEKIAHKLESQEVYLASQNGEVVGTITLDTNPVEYYREEEELSKFADPKAPALYVTALAVDPEKHGQGIAGNLMNFADSEARKRGISYVRFDCRDRYSDLVNFYKKRGYVIVGTTIDEEDNNEVYDLMEKKV